MEITAIMSNRVRVGVTLLGLAGLALFGSAYWLTYEPAPRIRVLWQKGVSPHQRATLERKYLLVNGRDPVTEGSLAYDLLDTRPSNIQSLVDDPAVADTNDIERHTYVVPFDVEYGIAWMWVAHRTPVLRDVRVRVATILTLAALAICGLIAQIHAVTAQRKQGNRKGPNVPVR